MELLKELVLARAKQSHTKNIEGDLFEAVKALPEYQAYESARKHRIAADKEVKAAESALKDVVDAGLESGGDRPGFVHRVREQSIFSFDMAEAVEWAKKHMPVAVVESVDRSLVEPTWEKMGLPDFVAADIKRTIYLKSGDLSEFLTEEDAKED